MKPGGTKNHELKEPHALTGCIANTDNCAEYGNQVVLMKTNKLCDFSNPTIYNIIRWAAGYMG